MAPYCIIINSSKYPEISKKMSKRAIAAYVVQWQKDNKKTMDDFPNETELNDFIKSHNTTESQRAKTSYIMDLFKKDVKRPEFNISETYLDIDFSKFGLRAESTDAMERLRALRREIPFVIRQDRVMSLYKTFQNRVIQEQLKNPGITMMDAVRSLGGPAAIFNSIKSEMIRFIVTDTQKLVDKEVSKIKEPTKEEIDTIKKKYLYAKDAYVKVVNNFTTLSEQSCNMIRWGMNLFIDINNDNVEDIQSDINSDDIAEDTYKNKDDSERIRQKDHWMNHYSEVSNESSLSKTTRLMLDNIIQVDKKGRYKKDDLGNKRYIDFNEAHSILINWLIPMIDDTDMIPLLEEMSKYHPWVTQLINEIQTNSTDIDDQNDANRKFTALFNDMCCAFIKYHKELISYDDNGVAKIGIKNLNDSEPIKTLYDTWRNNYQNGDVIGDENMSVYGKDRSIIPENAKKIVKLLQTSLNTYSDKNTQKEGITRELLEARRRSVMKGQPLFNNMVVMLNSLGIDIDSDDLENILTNIYAIDKKGNPVEIAEGERVHYKTYDPYEALCTGIFTIVNTISENKINAYKEGFDLINEFSKRYRTLARHLQSSVKNAVEANIKEGDTTRYAHAKDNYIFRLMRVLRQEMHTKKAPEGFQDRYTSYFDYYINEKYKKYDWFYDKNTKEWNIDIFKLLEGNVGDDSDLRRCLTDFKDMFDIGVVLQQKSANGTKDFETFGDRESAISQLVQYKSFDSASESNWARYYLPLPAEAGFGYVMTLPKYLSDENGTTQDKIADKFVEIVKQEYNRIMEVRERAVLVKEGVLQEKDLVASYDKFGDTFRFLPGLNVKDDNGEYHIINIINEAKADFSNTDLRNTIKQEVARCLEADFRNSMKDWKNWGILDSTSGGVNKVLGTINRERHFVNSLLTVLNIVNQGKNGIIDVNDLNAFPFNESLYNTLINSGLLTSDSWEILVTGHNARRIGNNILFSQIEQILYNFLQPYIVLNKNKTAYTLRDKIDYSKIDENTVSNIMRVVRPALEFLDNVYQTGKLNEKIKETINNVNKTDPTTQALRDFFYNSTYAQAEMIELITGDLAFYKNLEEWIKRAKQFHAPGMRLNVNATWNGKKVSDGFQRAVFLKDQEKPSPSYGDIEKTLNLYLKNPAERKLALSLYKRNNLTDAQSLRKLSSYRKIAIMSNDWNEQKEASYQRFMKGEFDMQDFLTVYNAIKPYVYTDQDITWTDAAGNERHFKAPLQIKTSETVLLTMYAQLASMAKTSPVLAALNEFGGDNVDVFVFGSAIKDGSNHTIDLNSVEDTGDFNKTKNTVVSQLNNLVQTDPKFIHTLDLHDYVIQTPNPEHLFDVTQLLGTQLTKLITSDVSDDTLIEIPIMSYFTGDSVNIFGVQVPFTIDKETGKKLLPFKDAKRLYHYVRTANIMTDFKSIKDEFADIESLEKLLKEQVMSSATFSPDLLEACTLVTDPETGEKYFNIPLGDPVQSRKVQSLLYSIIKNNVTKQKIDGGSAVQISAFGYDEELAIRFTNSKGELILNEKEFDENKAMKEKYKTFENYKKSDEGSVTENPKSHIAYAECYLPVYNTDLLQYLHTDENGILRVEDIPEEYRDELLNIVGFRIPTEDKFSMLPLKIKGFLPQSLGSSIILPADWVTISGSDFDIDHLYLMLPGLETFEDGQVRKIKYDFGKSALNQNVDFKKARKARNNVILDFVYGVLTNSETMGKLLNPGGFNEQKKSARVVRISENIPLDRVNALKEQFGVVSDEELFNRLETFDLNALDLILNEYKTIDNPLSPTVWVKNHSRISSSGMMIGIYADQSVNHALLQHTNVTIKPEFVYKIDEWENNSLHERIGAHNVVISKNVSEHVDSSVDDVKDPTLSDTNQNTFTADVAITNSRIGHDKYATNLLLTQPIIKEMTKEYFDNFGNKSKESAITTILYKWKSMLNEQDQKAFSFDKLKAGGYTWTKANMFHNKLQARRFELGQLTNEEYYKYIQDQVAAGELYYNIFKISKVLGDIVKFCKADTSAGAAGPDIATTENRIAVARQILQDSEAKSYPLTGVRSIVRVNMLDRIMQLIDSNPDEVLNMFSESPFPAIQASFTFGIESANILFKDYFPEFNSQYPKILDQLRSITKTGKLSPKLVNRFYRDSRLYVFTAFNGENNYYSSYTDYESKTYEVGKKDPVTGKVLTKADVLRKWIYDFPFKFKTMSMTMPELKNNMFTSRLRTFSKTKSCNAPTINFMNVGHLNNRSKWIIGNYWGSLFESKDPKIRQLADELFFYAGLRTAWDFGPDTYIHLANTFTRESVNSDYIDCIRNMEKGNFNLSGFLEMFILNNLNERSLSPEVSIDVFSNTASTDEKGRTVYKAEDKVLVDVKNIRGANAEQLVLRKGLNRSENTYHPYITIVSNGEDIYYKKNEDESDDETLVYERINPLGIAKHILVYDAQSDPKELIDVIDTKYVAKKGRSKTQQSVSDPHEDTPEIKTTPAEVEEVDPDLESLYNERTSLVDEFESSANDEEKQAIKIQLMTIDKEIEKRKNLCKN